MLRLFKVFASVLLLSLVSMAQNQTVTINLSKSAIRHLGTVGTVLVPAQGFGAVIVPVSWSIQFKQGSTANYFSGTSNLIFTLGRCGEFMRLSPNYGS